MSIPDKAMKLKDGKLIADQLSSMVAVQFATDTANEAETYVVYNGSVYYLPNGHTAGTSWANTEKEGPTNIGEKLTTFKEEVEELQQNKAPVIIESATGNPIVFHDGADGLPLSECKLTLLPKQSGTGDPSPTNIRPLIPWGEVGTWHGGKNLLNISGETLKKWALDSNVFKPISDDNQRVTFSINGNTLTISTQVRYLGVCFEVESCPFARVVSVPSSFGAVQLWSDYEEGATRIATGQSSCVIPANTSCFVALRVDNIGTVETTVQLEVGDTATAYTPYSPITPFPVNLTGITPPVYGCELDLVTGEVWGTWVSKEFDGSEGELWRKLGSGSASAFAMFLQISDKNTDTNAICDSLTTISRSATWGNFDNWISDNGASIITGIQSITTVEAWREYLSEHPIQVCYKLATPVLLATLSPQEITTLLGTNTIWSDADSIDVEYRADTGLFLKQNTVKDVQVNGTSVTTDGVANVPLATNSTNGVLHPQTDRGVSVGSTGILSVNSSTSNEIKAGVHQYKPITPNRQHESTFYGLAKLAGVDMAQSSNAVGTYTDEAKIAIQKMLGIYEAPWEIIRDDTVTNASASDIEITVDGIGNAFELTDIIVYGILSATDVQAEFGSFGQSEYYYGSSDKDTVLNNTITVNVGTTKVFVSVIEQENGLLRKYGTTGAISGNTGSFLSLLTSNLRGNPVPFIIPDTKPRIYTKIVLKTITGKLQYRIFGKRKWN